MEPWTFALIGAGAALIMLIIMSLGSHSRDSVLITAPVDVAGIARGWADHHYYAETPAGPILRFKKGKGFLTAATFVDIYPAQGGTQVDGYIRIVGIGRSRMMSLTNSSFVGKMPRKKSLGEFNALLGALGHPPLHSR